MEANEALFRVLCAQAGDAQLPQKLQNYATQKGKEDGVGALFVVCLPIGKMWIIVNTR